jgi:hypothetical protein
LFSFASSIIPGIGTSLDLKSTDHSHKISSTSSESFAVFQEHVHSKPFIFWRS